MKIDTLQLKQKSEVRTGVISLSSPLEVGADRAPSAQKKLADTLQGCGFTVLELGAVDSPERAVEAGLKISREGLQVVVCAATSWFEDYLVLDMLEECAVPVLLWALPGMETGALCGTQQLAAYLAQLETPFLCVYGEFTDKRPLDDSVEFVKACALRYMLRRTKIGFAGYRVNGMTEVAVNEIALKKIIGPRIIPIDVPLLLQRASEIKNPEITSLWNSLKNNSAQCRVPDCTGTESMGMYAAIREIVANRQLSALTIGCYPHLMGKVCLAASLLADDGVPMGCEGDINGALGQLILTSLTGQPTHNTDWLEPLPGTDYIILTHCGSGSFSLAEKKDEILLAPVRLMTQGVCALFPAKPGPVTLLSLIPRGSGYQIAMLEGNALSGGMDFPGNPVRVDFGIPASRLIEWIFQEGIGHHWMVGYGHVGGVLKKWAKLCGSELRFITMQ